MFFKALLLAAVIASAAACTTQRMNPDAVQAAREIPTTVRSEVWTGRINGRLDMRGNCLVLRSEPSGETYLLIWPNGSRFDGRYVAIANPGEPEKVIAIGQRVSFDGSNLTWDAIGHLPALHRFRPGCDLPLFFVVNVR